MKTFFGYRGVLRYKSNSAQAAIFIASISYVAWPNSTSAQFAKDDEVKLLRDEPLNFRDTMFRQAKKGETFTVLQYRPDLNKVYLLSTDSSGKPFAVNVPEAAVMVVPKDADVIASKGFAILRVGDLANGRALLLDAARIDSTQDVWTEVASRVEAISLASEGLLAARTRLDNELSDIERQRRNAVVAGRPNILNPGDTSGRQRAREMLDKAERQERGLKEGVTTAQSKILEQLHLVNELIKKQVGARSFSVALDLSSMSESVAAKYLPQQRFDSPLHEYHFNVQEKVTLANESLKKSKAAIAQKQLVSARKLVAEGLAVEAGRLGLLNLASDLDKSLDACGKALAEALSKRDEKQYEAAQKALQPAQEICEDYEKINTLVAALKKLIGEKETKLAQAKASEEAGDIDTAFAIYDTYGQEDAAKSILSRLAKREEEAGNFLRSYELYLRAGMSVDIQRVKQSKDTQIAEYQKAAVLLIERKFDSAIAIYNSYKDSKARTSALKMKGAFFEERQEFDNSIQAYKSAGATEDIARVEAFRENRAKWLSEGSQQEQSGNYDRALDLFTQARSRPDILRVAKTTAQDFEKKEDFESAAAYFEIAGLYEEAGRIRKSHDLTKATSKRSLSARDIFNRCSPACVTVATDSAIGSGFFVSKGGYVLTNNHVIDGAKSITIETSSGKVMPAKLIGSSKVPDLALLKIDLAEHPVLKIGDSDKVQTGSAIYAIGTPQGLAQSITDGIISNTNREFAKNHVFQISALINHGSSGGPLIDETGAVIGVNTFVMGTAGVLDSGVHIGSDIQGINYAIKIKEATGILYSHSVY